MMKLIPSSVKGKIFSVLTFLNLGMASYFAATGLAEQSFLSGITAFLCLGVWLVELRLNKE